VPQNNCDSFLVLGRKTKHALIYRLRHKTNGGRTV
jgi:hypothetical protein